MSLELTTERGAPRETDSLATVVNVLSHGPGYGLLTDQRGFLQSWQTPSGETVGIVNREWPGHLGHWVLEQSDRFRWEVWQPDIRADRPYAHEFPDGVTHRLFPARTRVFRPGLFRPVDGVESPSLFDALQSLRGTTLLVLHGFEAPWWRELTPRLAHRLPTLLVAHGTARSLGALLRGARHPLTPASLIVDHLRTRRAYARLAGITTPNETTRKAVRGVYSGRIVPLTMGCDFGFWRPPDAAERAAIRTSLGIPPNTRVFLTSAFLRPVKQVDRLIAACSALGERSDYLLLVVGQGDEQYVNRLQSLGRRLVDDGRLRFHPYASGDALRGLYWAADAFVSTSRAEGASVAVMEAMACGLPVLCTPVGGTYELMRHAGVGTILPAQAFEMWPAVLSGALPKAIDRDVARAQYDWSQVATRFIAILNQVALHTRAHAA